MTPSDKLREIAVKWCPWSEKTSFKRNGKDYVPFDQMVSDLTALISEGYVEKAKYDEAVRQRDEELVNQEVVRRIADKMVEVMLREELIAYDKFLSSTYWGVSHILKHEEAVDEYLKNVKK